MKISSFVIFTWFNNNLNTCGFTKIVPSTLRAAGKKDSDVSRLITFNLPWRITSAEPGWIASVAMFMSTNAVLVGSSHATLYPNASDTWRNATSG